jgi:hypothetical protein
MTAIITETFKKQIIQDLYNNVQDSAERYFIGIGRSQDWDSADTAPTPVQTAREIRNARLNLQSIKSAEDVSFVIPRTNWIAGTIYNAWNDNQAGYPNPSYYVLTDQNTVYICLQQGKNANGTAVASTVQPSGSSTLPFTTADGYVWKFLYTITALNVSKFLTANYMPVRLVGTTDSSSPGLDVEQKGIQDAAVVGQVSSITVTSAGTGYSSAPTVSIVGDGTGALATATISGGGVVKIEMDNDSSALGSGYTYAEAVLSGGGFTTAAKARPVIGPDGGFGADPRDDLRSTGIMFNSKPSGEEGGDFVIDNDYRQIVIIKGVKNENDSDFTGNTGNMLRALKFGDVNVAFTADKTIQGSTSGAKAYIDKYDGDTKTIFFHQTEETGFKAFTEGEAITETNGSGDGTLDSAAVDGNSLADSAAEANAFSGKILYIDNRAAVDRSAEQTEDIKAIISL